MVPEMEMGPMRKCPRCETFVEQKGTNERELE
jgi:hypothetical protein